jgi:hypothetical protein
MLAISSPTSQLSVHGSTVLSVFEEFPRHCEESVPLSEQSERAKCILHILNLALSCSIHSQLEWWEASKRPQARESLSGVPWWLVPGASTSNVSEACNWRSRRFASVMCRSVYPKLAAVVLLLPSSCCGGPGDVDEFMRKLLNGVGMSWGEVREWHQAQDWSASRVAMGRGGKGGEAQAKEGVVQDRPDLSAQLMILSAASFAMGIAVRQAGEIVGLVEGGGNGVETRICEAVEQNVEIVLDILGEVSVRLVHGIANVDAEGERTALVLVDGVVLHGLTVLVRHELWLLSCMIQVWSGTFHLGGPALLSTAEEAVATAIKSVAGILVRVTEDLCSSLNKCKCVQMPDSAIEISDVGMSSTSRRVLGTVADDEAVNREVRKVVEQQQDLLRGLANILDRYYGAASHVLGEVSSVA